MILVPCFIIVALFSLIRADQIPFSTHTPHKRLAIIGAGAAGASSAYFARQFSNAANLSVSITVFERNSYVGGRSTTVHAFDDEAHPVEVGASIFVRVNRILLEAAEKFGLELESVLDSRGGGGDALGVWDGNAFVFTQARDSYWDLAKMLWKYGLSPIRTQRLVQSTINKFLKMYESPVFPWQSLTRTAEDLDLVSITGKDGLTFLRENSVSAIFAKQLIQAATRVNYASNLGFIHGLEAMVCMAPEAVAVLGGNWQIFSAMINDSQADLRLNTAVTHVIKNGHETWNVTTADGSELFDDVVIAGPYQYSNIDLGSTEAPEKIEYVDLFVTLFATPFKLSPEYFGYKDKEFVPDMILTTLPADEDQVINGVGPTGFYSVNLWKTSSRPTRNGGFRNEFVYKIFSPVLWEDEKIRKMLNNTAEDSTEAITWTHRRHWNSYPIESPRVTFQEQHLDSGLWYTAGMESFISTMETNALSGKNVAANIVEGWANSKQVTPER